MIVFMVLLLVPPALAMVLVATGPSFVRPRRRPTAAVIRPDRVRQPRHARVPR
ncbi:hypothetical protein ABT093_03725 [Kitasatospora sp. NPDC002551]|uniref:hypothetical protein n=1 Tax=unclassified Kitasatospora TaxID=2633591 RepID=UPI00332D1757